MALPNLIKQLSCLQIAIRCACVSDNEVFKIVNTRQKNHLLSNLIFIQLQCSVV